MKKTLIKFLVLVLALCAMLCFTTACAPHEHTFTNYTSDNNATYNNDGTKTATCDYEGCEKTHTIVDAGTKLQSYIEFKTLSLEEKNIFSNATETFSFLGEIEIKGNAKFSVSLDLYGTQIVLTKIAPLTIGDNKFYVFELIDNDVTKVYEITIRRRPMYEVTFNVNGGTETQSQFVEESFMATEPETAPTREGYTFDGWDFDFSSPITENTVIDAKWTANGDTPYRVEYYLQNLGNDNYTLEQTENLTGKTDTTAIAEIKNFEHFTATETTVSGNINADGSTVLKVYYTRNRYSVILNAMDNKGSVTGAGTYKYGTQVMATATGNAGYTFDGWYNGQARVSANLTYTFTLSEDVTLTAKWTANGDTPYTIEYYQENLENSGYSLVNSEEKSGKTDDTINITPKTIEHFTFNSTHADNILSATIKGDGSTVFKVFYTRNTYAVILNAQDSKGSVTGAGTYKYGTQVMATATGNAGYTFDGWYNGQARVSANLTYTFTLSEDVTLTAKWTANGDTPYTIEYYQENLENSGYSLVNSEEKSGKTDDTINITPKTIEHFTFNSTHADNILSATIKGDGSTVLKIYYTRNSYTVTLNAQDNKGSVTGAGTYKYGTQVTATATVNTGYTFYGWYNGQARVSTEVAYTFDIDEDINLVAKWEANYILANFNSENDVDKVSSTKDFTELASGVVSEEAPSGALVAKVNAECVPLDIMFNKTLVFDASVSGIYIRMKSHCKNLYLGLLNANGLHYKGTGAEYSINKNFSAISANPGKQTGDWYTYYFTRELLIKQCGVTVDSEIGGIRLYSHYGGTIHYEIDEIGTYNYADLTDDTLDTNVVADFNDDVYGGLISSERIYQDSATYNTLLLTKNEYVGVGATSGVLLYATNEYKQSAMINLPKAINCAEAKYIYITLNSTVKAPSSLNFYFNDSATLTGLKDIVVSSGDTSIINGWTTLYLDTQKLINKGFSVIESIRFYLPACGKIYIDEIGVVTADRMLEDNNLAENMLADFDETLYICNSNWTTAHSAYTAFVDSTHADYATIGATSGCLKYHFISYSQLFINFQKGVKISETNGIILRLYASKDVSGSNFRIALGADGTYGSYMMPGLTGGAWVDLVITPDMLLEAGYDLDATYNCVKFTNSDPGYDFYIDSISIAPLA